MPELTLFPSHGSMNSGSDDSHVLWPTNDLIILSLELLSSNHNRSARISTCLFLKLQGPEKVADPMGGSHQRFIFPVGTGHGLGAATLQRASYCHRHWLGATTVLIAIKFLLFVFRSSRAWMADQNGLTFTSGLFFQWAWTRRCNITAGHFLQQTLACRYSNNNSTKNSYCLCPDFPDWTE